MPAERPSSAAAAARVSYELPEADTAAAVCCGAWFGGHTSRLAHEGVPLLALLAVHRVRLVAGVSVDCRHLGLDPLE